MKLEPFIQVVEVSVKRNGPEKVLTVGRLLKFLKEVKELEASSEDKKKKFEDYLIADSLE